MVPLALAAGVLAGAPAGAGAATAGGVVVGRIGGSVLVASPAGVVAAFRGRASVGSRVEVARGRLVVEGRARTARLRGIVVRRIGATTFLSSGGHLLAVHRGRGLASANDAPPPSPAGAVGQQVSMQVSVDGSQLDAESVDDLGPAGAGAIPVQATVAAVGAGTVTLTVAGQSLVLSLPGGLTLPAALVGQTVTLGVSLNGQNGENDQVAGAGTSSGSSSGGDGGGDGGGD